MILQIFAVIFLLILIYFSFMFYKRKEYSIKDFIFWLLVWIIAIFLVSFPETVYGVMESLQIQRTVDFFVIAGFMFLTVVIFFLYTKIRKLEYKIEIVVRKIALKK